VERLVAVDPTADPGLQHFWDKAWAAYSGGDLTTAKQCSIHRRTYASPNVEASSRVLVRANRRARRTGRRPRPLWAARPCALRRCLRPRSACARCSASSVATESVGNASARLARDRRKEACLPSFGSRNELTALFDMRDALREIQKNRSRTNQPFADALLADLYNSNGDTELMYRTIRRDSYTGHRRSGLCASLLSTHVLPVKIREGDSAQPDHFGVDPSLIMALCSRRATTTPRPSHPSERSA